jgi:hypothetical protein
MNRGSIRFLKSALGCALIAAVAAPPGFAQRPNPAPDPAPAAASAQSSEPPAQSTEPSATASKPKRHKRAVSTRTPKAEKPDRPEKKQKNVPVAKRKATASPARSHAPDPGGVAVSAALPTAAAIRSEPDTVPFSTKARVLLVGTLLLTALLLAAAVAPRRILARLSVDGLQERRADVAFAGLCVLTVGSLLGTLVAISG